MAVLSVSANFAEGDKSATTDFVSCRTTGVILCIGRIGALVSSFQLEVTGTGPRNIGRFDFGYSQS